MDVSRCIGAGIANEVITIAIIAGMSTVFVARAVDQVPSSQLWIRLDVANQIPKGPHRRCRDLQCGWRGTEIVNERVAVLVVSHRKNKRAESRDNAGRVRKVGRWPSRQCPLLLRRKQQRSRTRASHTHQSLMVKFRSEDVVFPILLAVSNVCRSQSARPKDA